jgi:hypothetical protein
MRILPDITGLSGIPAILRLFSFGTPRLIVAALMQMRILGTPGMRLMGFSVLFQPGFMIGHISLLCLRLAVTETPPDIVLFQPEKAERLRRSRVESWCNAKESKDG